MRPTVSKASSRSFGSRAVLLRSSPPRARNLRRRFGVCARVRKMLPTGCPRSAIRLSKISRSASGRSSRLRYGTRAIVQLLTPGLGGAGDRCPRVVGGHGGPPHYVFSCLLREEHF